MLENYIRAAATGLPNDNRCLVGAVTDDLRSAIAQYDVAEEAHLAGNGDLSTERELDLAAARKDALERYISTSLAASAEGATLQASMLFAHLAELEEAARRQAQSLLASVIRFIGHAHGQMPPRWVADQYLGSGIAGAAAPATIA